MMNKFPYKRKKEKKIRTKNKTKNYAIRIEGMK